MRKLQLLIVLLLGAILIAGCAGEKVDYQTIEAGNMILDRDMIESVTIEKAACEADEASDRTLQWIDFLTFSNSVGISSLTARIEEIPVRKLTSQEDDDFMKKRIQEEGLLDVKFNGKDNSYESLKGYFLIWPDGCVYTVDVNSMRSNERTIAYLSEGQYPEIYEWLTDQADANESAAEILTQIESAERFVEQQGYQIMMNSGANYDLQLPGSFDQVINGVNIGDLLNERNEISKQNGLDFSSYLGQPVTLITYGVESEQKEATNIDLIMDSNQVVGFWIDDHGEPPDFNVIMRAFEADVSR